MESAAIDPKDYEKPVDREKSCPLLLRVFCNNNRHHPLAEYAHGNTPTNELQIYTWLDASLKELTSLVKEVNADARRKGTYFDFAIVRPDPRAPVYRLQEIGTTCSGKKGQDDNISLRDKNFQIGEYIDIAVQPPRPGGGPDFTDRGHDDRVGFGGGRGPPPRRRPY